MSDHPSDWQASKSIATMWLRSRQTRRELMTRTLILLLVLFAVGVWPLDGWLMSGIWRFAIYWGATGFLCLFLILLTLYDVLAVVKEEQVAFSKEHNPLDPDELDRLVKEAREKGDDEK